jgi:thiamine-monophosphate kinase
LSDIAAMGGSPTAAFLSIGLPKDISIEWLDEFFAGIQNLSEQTSTPLLGGDTTKSLDRIIINFAVLGKAHPDKIKFRSSALVDDVICVTDYLGDSSGGLNIILNNLNDDKNPDKQQLILAHHQPLPRLAEGKWLAEQAAVHAMMDVSDGIDSDIKRIMEESHVGARVDVVDIPISPTLRAVSRHYGWNVTEIAASGGEDYCLLCTIDPSHFQKIADDFAGEFGRPLFKIGRIQKGAELFYYQNGQRIDFTRHGWDHFR